MLEDGLQAMPLDLSGVGLQSATLDGKPAAIGPATPTASSCCWSRARAATACDWNDVAPLQTTAARQVLNFRLPQPAAARFRLTACPATSRSKAGPSVASRVVDDAGRA